MADPLERPSRPMSGKVWLVGAGPGAADLITVRGARILAKADVVLYDALVTPEILALCRSADLISVGKRSGQRSTAQSLINQQLVASAFLYERVVRLKGGDSMLFGRADEEMRALEQANISFEVVPGVTTAFAAAASIKQPLTKRGVARNVAFFTSTTGREEPDQPALPECDTLIQYMGGQEAIDTAHRLIAHGKSPNTPVIVVENVSRKDESVSRLSLGEMMHGLSTGEGPVLVMIGEALRSRSDI